MGKYVRLSLGEEIILKDCPKTLKKQYNIKIIYFILNNKNILYFNIYIHTHYFFFFLQY